jgi:hypothetical protein
MSEPDVKHPEPIEPPDVDAEFLDALARGRNHGDLKAVDESGRPVKRKVDYGSKKIRT